MFNVVTNTFRLSVDTHNNKLCIGVSENMPRPLQQNFTNVSPTAIQIWSNCLFDLRPILTVITTVYCAWYDNSDVGT